MGHLLKTSSIVFPTKQDSMDHVKRSLRQPCVGRPCYMLHHVIAQEVERRLREFGEERKRWRANRYVVAVKDKSGSGMSATSMRALADLVVGQNIKFHDAFALKLEGELLMRPLGLMRRDLDLLPQNTGEPFEIVYKFSFRYFFKVKFLKILVKKKLLYKI